jgi:hypothetical protein
MRGLFVEITGVDQGFPQSEFEIFGSRHTPFSRSALDRTRGIRRDFDREFVLF